jgi:sulfite exporter TauE/SafE
MDALSTTASAAVAALAVGLTGSAHCALMCGPLACAAGALGSAGSRWQASVAWHGGRLLSYFLAGALLGTLGDGLTRHPASSALRAVLPWILAAGLVASALELGRHAPAVPGLQRIARGIGRRAARLTPARRAAALGAVTPLLPCGLLYGLFLAAAATGSGAGGSLLMGAFALGATPALVTVQSGSSFLQRWPRAALVLRRGVPLLAAAVIVWRAVHLNTAQAATACH